MTTTGAGATTTGAGMTTTGAGLLTTTVVLLGAINSALAQTRLTISAARRTPREPAITVELEAMTAMRRESLKNLFILSNLSF